METLEPKAFLINNAVNIEYYYPVANGNLKQLEEELLRSQGCYGRICVDVCVSLCVYVCTYTCVNTQSLLIIQDSRNWAPNSVMFPNYPWYTN